MFTPESLLDAHRLACFQETANTLMKGRTKASFTHTSCDKKVDDDVEILDGDNRCEMNESNVRSFTDEHEILMVEVDKKSSIEDGKDIESNSSMEYGDNDGGVILDNNLEGDINEEGEISTGNNKKSLRIELRISEMDDKSKCVDALDDDCKETKSRVCGIDDDNRCLNDKNTTVETARDNEKQEDCGLDDSKGEMEKVSEETRNIHEEKVYDILEKEDETDNDVIKNKTLRGLLNLGCGSDGSKVNSSVNGVSDSGIMGKFDVVINSSKGDWTSNFNKPVDIIKECSVEQKESRKDNNNLVASDIVRDKFVNEYAKREE
ncbi:hypothetical protein Tco_1225732, partial [Tanacetum coccineum]